MIDPMGAIWRQISSLAISYVLFGPTVMVHRSGSRNFPVACADLVMVAFKLALRFFSWALPSTVVVVASYHYIEYWVLFPSIALANRINPTTNSGLVTCNYSIIVAYHTRVTVRTGHLLAIKLARTYAATNLASG